MRGHRAVWVSVVTYLMVVVLLLGLAGCVKGEPFAPEMCEVRMDSLVVTIKASTLQLCALSGIRTEAER